MLWFSVQVRAGPPIFNQAVDANELLCFNSLERATFRCSGNLGLEDSLKSGQEAARKFWPLLKKLINPTGFEAEPSDYESPALTAELRARHA